MIEKLTLCHICDDYGDCGKDPDDCIAEYVSDITKLCSQKDISVKEKAEAPYSALQVANFVLYTIYHRTDIPKQINLLSLQTLLYDIQKEYLKNGKKCFADNIVAFQSGPRIWAVFCKYASYGSAPLGEPENEAIYGNSARDEINAADRTRITDIILARYPYIDNDRQPRALIHVLNCAGEDAVIPDEYLNLY